MSYRDIFMQFAVPLIEEFGFKYTKTNKLARQKMGDRLLEVYFNVYGIFSVYFRYSIFDKAFAEVYNQVYLSIVMWRDELVQLSTEAAFMNYPQSEFPGKYHFKDQAPTSINLGKEDKYFTGEEACQEFERLVHKHMMPWFDRYKDARNIRSDFRTNPQRLAVWNNTQFTPLYSSKPGGVFQPFWTDMIICRLLDDESRTPQEVFDTFYKKDYILHWDEVKEKTPREIEYVTTHFAAIPQLIDRLEQVSQSDWEKYRKLTGIYPENIW